MKGEGWKARDRLIWRAAPCPPCRDHCSRGSCRRTWRWRQWRRWGGCRTVRSWRPPPRLASPWTRAPPPAAPRTATHSLSGRCEMFADQVWQLSTVFGRVSSYGQLWSASRFDSLTIFYHQYESVKDTRCDLTKNLRPQSPKLDRRWCAWINLARVQQQWRVAGEVTAPISCKCDASTDMQTCGGVAPVRTLGKTGHIFLLLPQVYENAVQITS